MRAKRKENPPAPVRVLLAEDDDDLRTALSRLLSFDGYHVRSVRNGLEMLDVLASWIIKEADAEGAPPADVIVTDMRMPGVDGLNVVEGLRASGWTWPIIVMTAFIDGTTRRRVTQMGDVILLPKPFEPEALERLLAELVRPVGSA